MTMPIQIIILRTRRLRYTNTVIILPSLTFKHSARSLALIIMRGKHLRFVWQGEDAAVDRLVQALRRASLEVRATAAADQQCITSEGG